MGDSESKWRQEGGEWTMWLVGLGAHILPWWKDGPLDRVSGGDHKWKHKDGNALGRQHIILEDNAEVNRQVDNSWLTGFQGAFIG